MAEKEAGLSEHYNSKSIGHFVEHVAKHVVVMGFMMGVIGLTGVALPMGAEAATLSTSTSTAALGSGASVTIGDVAVQTLHGSWEMLKMIGDTLAGLLPVGEAVVDSMMSGSWMPTGYESIVMTHDMGAHSMAAGHEMMMAAHDSGFGSWVENAAAAGDLDIAMEDADALGVSLEEYYNSTYGHEGHEL